MGLGSQAAGKILDAFEAVQAENETLAAEKAALEEELEDVRRTSAVEKAIWGKSHTFQIFLFIEDILIFRKPEHTY